MKTRILGKSGLQVSALGLCCMGMSRAFDLIPDRQETMALIRTPVEQGVTFFDTVEVYGAFTNENRFTRMIDHGWSMKHSESLFS
jgi:aryl-alcohol dehydrogenase-like predicted oxidoreductase